MPITDADRAAARALREILADSSGFWHRFDDDSALCKALARHRMEAERRAVHPLLPGEEGVARAIGKGRVASKPVEALRQDPWPQLAEARSAGRIEGIL